MNDDSNTVIHPVINLTEKIEVFDLTTGYNSKKMSLLIRKGRRGIGGYNEKRSGMYLAPHFGNNRNVHLGIDFWAPAGEPVYSALDGVIAYTANHGEEGNYGATVVVRHMWKGKPLFALYGHLSMKSLGQSTPGREVMAGEIVGWIGRKSENGNWPPHLHYQLSVEDPGEADMPGVVSDLEKESALQKYPDPRILLGPIY